MEVSASSSHPKNLISGCSTTSALQNRSKRSSVLHTRKERERPSVFERSARALPLSGGPMDRQSACISKLKYNKSCWIQHSFRTRYPGIPLDRNHVSISAICEISSACGGSQSQKVELESERGNPVFTPAIDADHRMAVANGLGCLLPQVRELKSNYDSSEWVEDLRDDPPKITLSPDCICSALYRISMQLRHLEI